MDFRILSYWIVFSIVNFFSTGYSQSYWTAESYSGVQSSQKSLVLYDDFDNNINNWWLKDYGIQTASISNGHYLINSNDRTKSILKSMPYLEDIDFEIEMVFKIASQKKSQLATRSGGLIWGRHSRDKNQFSFSYNLKKGINAQKRLSASRFVFYLRNQEQEQIQPDGYNKLTVRKVDNYYYLFMNEILVSSFSATPFFGEGLGFAVSNGMMDIDYFRVSELNVNQKFVYNDLIAPAKESPSIKTIPLIPAPEIAAIELETGTQMTSDVDINIPLNNSMDKNKYALVIGNEDYTQYQGGLSSESNVDYAKADAITFSKYCIKTLGVPKENMVLLTDAISSQMRREIEKLMKLAMYSEGEAEIIFYYAGHGFPDEQSKESYLMPVDISGAEVTSGIKLSDLYSKLTKYPTKKVTVFLDACFSGGHVLLVGVPGLAKTLLVNSISNALGLNYSRIQFTPDLMPSDIIGSEVLNDSRKFEFIKGPIFANIILADEINRTPPKTQSALLEAMQEKSVTAGGQTFKLDQPFFVLATQNPIEQEGTYPLPEAQLDRFMFNIWVDYPTFEEEMQVVKTTTSDEKQTINGVLSGEVL